MLELCWYEDSDYSGERVGSGEIGGCWGRSGSGGRVPAATIVQLKLAGVGSELPVVSTALTWKVWLPGVRLLFNRLTGLLQRAAAKPSILHSNRTIGVASSSSVPVNVNEIELVGIVIPFCTLAPVLESIAEVICVSGGMVSIVVALVVLLEDWVWIYMLGNCEALEEGNDDNDDIDWFWNEGRF